jgi:phospholipid/cholesterol/gamma-HCH transport system ATP-binding protein
MEAMHTTSENDSLPVQVKTLHKSFGEQAVLNGINLQVRQGETLSILGRSGTGKSVLLKLIVGLQVPDSGSIRIHGKEIAGLTLDQLNEIRKKIGFLFQNSALYDSLTVEENVAFPLRRHIKMSDGERKKRVQELLSSVGMEQASQKMPGQISGGMQKRVGLARALALGPDILLFDEPTAGLDPITAAEIEELILRLQKERNMTSIVVTHDIHGAQTVSDRVALLRDGQILIEGTFEDLQKSSDAFVVQFLNDGTLGGHSPGCPLGPTKNENSPIFQVFSISKLSSQRRKIQAEQSDS